MLPTFVIGLREGLEAALIVGIIAAFLRQSGRREALRWVWLGVGLAVAVCFAVAVALRLVDSKLPQRGQEGLETIIALVAVGFVTYMIVWMRRNSRGLKASIELHAGAALAAGSVAALVTMAFFAVLREGFETTVFLLAVFQSAVSPVAAGIGAVLGVAVAVGLGYALYRGGVRLNLARFFRITGFVLVLVAGGLLASAFHTGHEAGWVNVLQGRAFDLTWLVQPGSVRAALLTGMLGLQPEPTVGEVVVWLAYVIPMSIYVLWPNRPIRRGAVEKAVAVSALLALALLASACGKDADPTAAGQTVPMSLTDAGCDPATMTLEPGTVTFEVTHTGTTAAVTEFEVAQDGVIIGEVENLTPGLSGSFTVDLEPGTYELLCPGGSEAGTGTLTVTGVTGGPTAAGATVPATLSDFTIDLGSTTVPAGGVQFDVTNQGPSTHELVVIRTDLDPTALPTASNGEVDEEGGSGMSFVGEKEDIGAGTETSFSLDLEAGSYVLLCNLPGHYAAGMATSLEVSAA